MRGWTIKPESGPARKTIDMSDLESPNDNRYGEARRGVKTYNRVQNENPTVAHLNGPNNLQTEHAHSKDRHL